MRIDLVKVSRARRLCMDGQGRRLRVAAQVSVRELAQAVGVNPATVCRWETGESAPRPDAAVRWVDALQQLAADDEDTW